MKLDVRAFAVSCAFVWGFGVLLATWWIIAYDGPSDQATFLGSIYRGYTITPVGSLVGFVWAMIDGLIAGAIFALIYNWFSSRPNVIFRT